MPPGTVKTPLSGRKTMLLPGVVLLLPAILLAAGCIGPVAETAVADTGEKNTTFEEDIGAVLSQERYRHSLWGIRAQDLDSGDVLLSMNEDQLFVPGSTTKVFTVTSALQILGKDYRFETPVYSRNGDLILVASGDLAMGGRGGANGTLAFTAEDHGDANALGGCILTEGDPLAGLDDLAEQVAESGISSVEDVVIDDRLFQQARLADAGIVTPILINDNLIDITVTPGDEGGPAGITWRPASSAYTVRSSVTTGPPGSETSLTIPDYTGQAVIAITGTVPADAAPVTMTSNVLVPAAFARSLFVDALGRAGVTVGAPAAGANPAGKLPEKAAYSDGERVAVLVSPPLSEYAKVTLKVSQNRYANCLLGIMAAHEGYETVWDGLLLEGRYLQSIGISLDGLALMDGEGSIENRISPLAATDLTSYIAGTDTYPAVRDAMPVLGVDGTLASGAEPGDPGYGEISAKTGTSLGGDMSGRAFAYSRGLLGYMTTANGTPVTFVIYVNNVPGIGSLEDLQPIVADVNRVAVILYESL